MQAGYLCATGICNDRIVLKCTDQMSEATSRKDSKSEHASVGRLSDTTQGAYKVNKMTRMPQSGV